MRRRTFDERAVLVELVGHLHPALGSRGRLRRAVRGRRLHIGVLCVEVGTATAADMQLG